MNRNKDKSSQHWDIARDLCCGDVLIIRDDAVEKIAGKMAIRVAKWGLLFWRTTSVSEMNCQLFMRQDSAQKWIGPGKKPLKVIAIGFGVVVSLGAIVYGDSAENVTPPKAHETRNDYGTEQELQELRSMIHALQHEVRALRQARPPEQKKMLEKPKDTKTKRDGTTCKNMDINSHSVRQTGDGASQTVRAASSDQAVEVDEDKGGAKTPAVPYPQIDTVDINSHSVRQTGDGAGQTVRAASSDQAVEVDEDKGGAKTPAVPYPQMRRGKSDSNQNKEGGHQDKNTRTSFEDIVVSVAPQDGQKSKVEPRQSSTLTEKNLDTQVQLDQVHALLQKGKVDQARACLALIPPDDTLFYQVQYWHGMIAWLYDEDLALAARRFSQGYQAAQKHSKPDARVHDFKIRLLAQLACVLHAHNQPDQARTVYHQAQSEFDALIEAKEASGLNRAQKAYLKSLLRQAQGGKGAM